MAIIYNDPEIRLYDNVLNHEQCKGLIKYVLENNHSSTVVQKKSGERVPSPSRDSYTAYITDDHPIIQELSKKVCGILNGLDPANFEGWQLTYYKTGGFYKPHFDFFHPDWAGSEPHLKVQGQRLITVLLYLNKPTEGGYTSFPNLGISTLPEEGRLLLFENVDADKKPHMNSCHGADPVSKGEKFIVTTWVRERKKDER